MRRPSAFASRGEPWDGDALPSLGKWCRESRGDPVGSARHLYTVCHVLECMPAFPALVPEGQDHIIECSVSLRDVGYSSGIVRYVSAFPTEVTMKLRFAPTQVQVGGRPLGQRGADRKSGWSFDPGTRLLTVRQEAGDVSILK